jgi:acetyl-CoA carboxylase alpha subunit
MLAPLLEEWDLDLRSGDPLAFPGYAERLVDLDHESVRTGLADGFVLIEGDFDVIGGSMGLVHGEKVVRAIERSIDQGLPLVLVTRSGGARMQEGMLSLVQMARTAAAMQRHHDAGLLSLAVHRSPTTGGVFASYGSLADLAVAEAGATIGFAGPRVVRETTGEEVAGRSHTAETALAHHLVDAVVPVAELAAWVAVALGRSDAPLLVSDPPAPRQPADVAANEVSPNEAWSAVLAARALGRPSGIHLAAAAATSWTELGAGSDPALRVALATVAGRRAVVLASDRYAPGGGQPTPAGYGLARRGIALAGRLGLPVLGLVDTPGADPRPDAENDGVAREIAATFAALASLRSPSVGLCCGEGGSGGALALVAADVLLVQEHAVFSVIGPEGAAAILERDATKAPEVARRLRLTAADAVALGVADAVVPDEVAATVAALGRALDDARAGQGIARFDRATAAWLRTIDGHARPA